MRRFSAWLLLLALLGTALLSLAPTAHAQAPAAEPLRTAGDRPVDIRHIRLDLRVDLPNQTVDGVARLQIQSLRPLASVALDAVGFEVKSVSLARDDKDGAPAHFSHDGHKLTIDLDPPWPPAQLGTLTIDYRIRKPKDGLYFFGPTPEEPDVPLTVWSQGEPISNRYWFPCLDQPNQRQTTELVVTVAPGFEVLSNGKLVERREDPADHTVTFHWLQDKPHVSYLVTLVVGKFDVVREEWQGTPVLYYVPQGRRADVARTFGRTREMIDYFSRRFGVRYPWEKYAQVVVEQFTGGGMENTSATTLVDSALHDDRSMLDSTPDGLIAHELAHQWWGDLLTCRDWAHLWLNEGFASYAEALWEEHSKGADDYAYEMYQKAGGAIGGGRSRPVVDHRYPEPGSMFDGRSYPKGAWLLHMLRRRLGDEAFWRCLQRYGTVHRLQSVETADFRKVLERGTGRDLERFFYDWAERPGSPVLEIKTEYLAETKQAKLVVKQTQAGEAFHFLLTVAFHCAPASQPVLLHADVTNKEHTFFVALPGRPTLVDIDPEQAVLAEIKEDKGRDLWLAQLREAPGVVSRIRAAKHLGQSHTPADDEALAGAFAAEKFWGVLVEMAGALGESGSDLCRDTLLGGLGHANPKVRRACAEHLGKFRRDVKVADALRKLLQKGDPGYTVEAAALASYAKLDQPDAPAVLLPWLAKPSHNEVLRSAALAGLGSGHDLSVLDTLLLWTKRGKPRQCRTAALDALARLANGTTPTEEQQRRIVTALSTCLEGEGPRLRGAAISALRELGRAATPALAALDALGLHDPNERVRDLARQARDQIRSSGQVPPEVGRLREQLDQLRREQETLKERLNRYEKRDGKGT
jgi:aminopeptidase N